MNLIMNKLDKALLAGAATLMFVPTLSAQRDVPYHEKGGVGYNKYVTSDKPDGEGEYTIHLETFTTGEVQVKKKSIPSDIVLVLDMSGSMMYQYPEAGVSMEDQMILEVGPTATYEGRVRYRYSSATGTINGPNSINGSTSNPSAFSSSNYTRYIRWNDAAGVIDNENGTFYQVTRGGDATAGYILFFTPADGVRHYLRGRSTDADQGVKLTRPTDVTSTSTNIWQGQLWRYRARVEALREAVCGFIQIIAQNDAEQVRPFLDPGVTGNQISIVQMTGKTEPEIVSIVEPATYTSGTTNVVKSFTEVNSTDNVDALTTAVNKMIASGSTPPDAGMRLAHLLLEDLEDRGMNAFHPTYGTRARHKTVVLFTDGEPSVAGDDDHLERTFCQIVYGATHSAKIIKDPRSQGGKFEGKVFSIGFASSGANRTFLQYTSSNYPDGLETVETGASSKAKYTGTLIPDPDPEHTTRVYYQDAAESDMSAVFQSIAEAVGGNNQEYGATSMVAVDIVSSSFQLPEGVDLSRVKVYTAQCLGILDETFTPEGETEAKHYLAFAQPKLAPTRASLDSLWVSHKVKSKVNPDADSLDVHGNVVYRWEKLENVDIDGTSAPGPDNTDGIRLKINPADNSVSITGFDFSQCWCGLDAEHENVEQYDSSDPNYSHHVAGYRGFKLIIEFPIKITEDAVGGPAVNTNLPGSGLYMTDENGNKTGEPIIVYPAPTLLVPVNLWISKKGLNKGESASFSIERKLAKKEHEGDPDPEYEYFTNVMLTGKPGVDSLTVKLLNLDPAYFYRVQENGWSWSYDTVIQPANAGQTTETTTHNPFVFQNTKKENMPKHAESVVNNDFKNGQAVTTSSKDHTYTPTP